MRAIPPTREADMFSLYSSPYMPKSQCRLPCGYHAYSSRDLGLPIRKPKMSCTLTMSINHSLFIPIIHLNAASIGL